MRRTTSRSSREDEEVAIRGRRLFFNDEKKVCLAGPVGGRSFWGRGTITVVVSQMKIISGRRHVLSTVDCGYLQVHHPKNR